MSSWPKCPGCNYFLLYVIEGRMFSCGCGFIKRMPEFLKELGIDENKLDLDTPDVQPEAAGG